MTDTLPFYRVEPHHDTALAFILRDYVTYPYSDRDWDDTTPADEVQAKAAAVLQERLASPNHHMLAFGAEGDVWGYVGLSFGVGQIDDLNVPYAEILGYALDLNARGKGLGQTLVLDAMAYAKRHHHAAQLVAWPHEDNAASLATLRKVGFQADSQRHAHKPTCIYMAIEL